MIERVDTPDAPKALGPYSQAVKAGGFLFISGMLAIDPATGELKGESAAEQTVQIFKNIRAVVKEGGAKMENIVKAVVYLSDFNDFSEVNKVYASELSSSPVLPSRAAVEVTKMAKGGKVEIEVTVAL